MPPKTAREVFLLPDELPPFEVVNADCASPLIIVCDHAANLIPQCFNSLGLSLPQLSDHIAWDPGAAQVARHLAHRLQAPLVLSQYSRLVIDCNRPVQSEELIPPQSAGVIIPGNQALSAQQRTARVDQFFVPYHQAIEQLIHRRRRLGGQFLPRILLSIHSFTPRLNQVERPWHIGVAARQDVRFAEGLYQALAQLPGLIVGFNKPYAIDDLFDYTLPTHGEAEGLHSAMIEIRQDGLNTQEQARLWAERIATIYNGLEAQFYSAADDS